MCHDWPVKKVIADLPITIKGNSKRSSGNLLSPLGAQDKDIGAASQTLLTKVKLCGPSTQACLSLMPLLQCAHFKANQLA